ncbi:hypothetical protein BaRGS_00034229 [Batillaria attramentaria]|uniref:Uncharacterized protein n=1 Tax=Batillaria attramentaria TaxID=370345 RepID=A0ABD0JIF6_9CAEN
MCVCSTVGVQTGLAVLDCPSMGVLQCLCENFNLTVLDCPEMGVLHCRCGNSGPTLLDSPGIGMLQCPCGNSSLSRDVCVLHCQCRNLNRSLLCCQEFLHGQSSTSVASLSLTIQ